MKKILLAVCFACTPASALSVSFPTPSSCMTVAKSYGIQPTTRMTREEARDAVAQLPMAQQTPHVRQCLAALKAELAK